MKLKDIDITKTKELERLRTFLNERKNKFEEEKSRNLPDRVPEENVIKNPTDIDKEVSGLNPPDVEKVNELDKLKNKNFWDILYDFIKNPKIGLIKIGNILLKIYKEHNDLCIKYGIHHTKLKYDANTIYTIENFNYRVTFPVIAILLIAIITRIMIHYLLKKNLELNLFKKKFNLNKHLISIKKKYIFITNIFLIITILIINKDILIIPLYERGLINLLEFIIKFKAFAIANNYFEEQMQIIAGVVIYLICATLGVMLYFILFFTVIWPIFKFIANLLFKADLY